VTEGVGKDFLAPVNLASDSQSVGVEQELSVVEAQPVSGLINALDTIAIELPRSDIGQEDMPGLVGLFGYGDAQLAGVRLGRVK
jgi:hypothetical protein